MPLKPNMGGAKLPSTSKLNDEERRRLQTVQKLGVGTVNRREETAPDVTTASQKKLDNNKSTEKKKQASVQRGASGAVMPAAPTYAEQQGDFYNGIDAVSGAGFTDANDVVLTDENYDTLINAARQRAIAAADNAPAATPYAAGYGAMGQNGTQPATTYGAMGQAQQTQGIGDAWADVDFWTQRQREQNYRNNNTADNGLVNPERTITETAEDGSTVTRAAETYDDYATLIGESATRQRELETQLANPENDVAEITRQINAEKALQEELRAEQDELLNSNRLSDEGRAFYTQQAEDAVATMNELYPKVFTGTATAEEIAQFQAAEQTYRDADARLGEDSPANFWERFDANVEGTAASGFAGAARTGADLIDGYLFAPKLTEADRREYIAAGYTDEQFDKMLAQAEAEANTRREMYGGEGSFIDDMYNFVEGETATANEHIAWARQNADDLTTTALDVMKSGQEMIGDAVLTMMGIPALAGMAVRVYGNSAEEARLAGMSREQQALYGLLHAGVEVFTEKMFDGVAGIYGEGAAETLMKRVITGLGEWGSTPAGQLTFGMLGEMSEEFVSGILDPVVDYIVTGNMGELDWGEIGNAMLCAAILGGVGSGASVTGGIIDAKLTPTQAQQIVENLENSEFGRQLLDAAEQAGMSEAELADALIGMSEYLEENTSADDAEAVAGVAEAANERINGTAEAETEQTAEEQQTETEEEETKAEERATPAEEQTEENAEEGRQAETEVDVFSEVLPTAESMDAERAVETEAPQFENNDAINELFPELSDNQNAAEIAPTGTSENNAFSEPLAEAPQITPAAETNENESGLTLQNEAENANAEQTVETVENNAIETAEAAAEETTAAEAQAEETAPQGEQATDNSQAIAALEEAKAQLEAVGADTTTIQQSIDALQTSGNANVGEPNARPPKVKRSRTESNTGQHIAEVMGGEQEELYYTPITEKETLAEAQARLGGDRAAEMEHLANTEAWSAADVDTALAINAELQRDVANGVEGAFEQQREWFRLIQERGSAGGQFLQAFAKWTRGHEGSNQADDVISNMEDNVTDKNRALLEPVARDIQDFGGRIDDASQSNSLDDIKQVIRDINEYRNTGTLIGKLFDKLLDRYTAADFDYLRNIALHQLNGIGDDFIANNSGVTHNFGDKLKTMQVLNQLLRLPTFERNIGGNAVFSTIDMFAQNAVGFFADRIIGAATGKHTIGFEAGWLSKANRQAANRALLDSVFEIALDVDMRTNANGMGNNARGVSTSRTWKSSGNIIQRWMSRFEQVLSYSLTASDRYFRGGIEASQQNAMGLSGLTEEEQQAVAENQADYRLFQNDGVAAQASRGLHNFFNLAGIGGEVNGAQRVGGFGLGDLVNAYPAVPANLGVKALEYSPLNAVKGIGQMAKLAIDAKNGVDVDAVAQSEAAMNFARGVTGTGLVWACAMLAKLGLFKRPDDDDYDVSAYQATEGRNGLQWNASATQRAINGESTEWQAGDKLVSIGWVEPANVFFNIGALIAEDEDAAGILDYAKDFGTGSYNAFMEIPVMSNLANAFNTFKYSTTENIGDKIFNEVLPEYLVSGVGGSFIPAFSSQLANTLDPYMRETRGDNGWETAVNTIVNKIPWLREEVLAPKLDGFGNERMYNADAVGRFTNNFLAPGTVTEYQPTEIGMEIERISSEVDTDTFKDPKSIYPNRRAPNSIRFDGDKYELSADEKYDYQLTYGIAYGSAIEQLMASEGWADLSPEEQYFALANVESYAEHIAKQAFFESRGIEYTDQWDAFSNAPDPIGYAAFAHDLNASSFADMNMSVDRAVEIMTTYGHEDEATAREKAEYWDFKRTYPADEYPEFKNATQADVTAFNDGKFTFGDMEDISRLRGELADANIDAARENWFTDWNGSYEEIDRIVAGTYGSLSDEAKAYFDHDVNKRVGQLYEAWNEYGIDAEHFFDAWNQFTARSAGDADDGAVVDNARWAAWLYAESGFTDKQIDFLKETFQNYSMSPAGYKGFDGLIENGYSAKEALEVIKGKEELEIPDGWDKVPTADVHKVALDNAPDMESYISYLIDANTAKRTVAMYAAVEEIFEFGTPEFELAAEIINDYELWRNEYSHDHDGKSPSKAEVSRYFNTAIMYDDRIIAARDEYVARGMSEDDFWNVVMMTQGNARTIYSMGNASFNHRYGYMFPED